MEIKIFAKKNHMMRMQTYAFINRRNGNDMGRFQIGRHGSLVRVYDDGVRYPLTKAEHNTIMNKARDILVHWINPCNEHTVPTI